MRISKSKLERAIRQLEPPSNAVRKLMSLVTDANHDSSAVVEIVRTDAPLTVRVLHVANSPVIAPFSPVESVSHAVSLMGERAVVAAALLIGADWLTEPMSGYGPEAASLFENGLRTAIAAELIAHRVGRGDLASVAYTGGLLVDIGKLVLSQFMGPLRESLVEEVSAGGADSWLAAERKALGFDHCEVGAMLADHFELGPSLRAVIAHHHAPGRADGAHRTIVEIVHVADAVRALVGGDCAADTLAYPLDRALLEAEGIDADDLIEIVCETLVRFGPMNDAVGGSD